MMTGFSVDLREIQEPFLLFKSSIYKLKYAFIVNKTKFPFLDCLPLSSEINKHYN